MAIIRSEDFLVTTWVGDASRRFIWHGDKPQELDLPLGWIIERHGEKLRIRNCSVRPYDQQIADALEFDVPGPGHRQLVELPSARTTGPHRPLDIEIVRMRTPEPVFLLKHLLAPNYPSKLPKQLMLFYGERYLLVRYRPVGPTRVVSNHAQEVFQYSKTSTGYLVTALSQGLKLKTATEKINIGYRSSAELTEQAFFSATFIYGVHWWRFRMVPTPDSLPPIETEETEDDVREELRYKQSALASLLFFLVALMTMYNKSLHIKQPPKIIAAVEIKQPKIIPPTKEELKPPPKPPEPPPEPPKVVELKPEPEPPKPLPRKKTPKPKKIAKVKPIKQQTPEPPPKIVKQEPPPPDPAVIKAAQEQAAMKRAAEQKAAETAAAKQQLMKSLGFISTSSKRAAADPQTYDQKEGRFTETPTVGADVSKTNSLDKLVKDAPGGGSIKTKSSRTVASSVNFGPKAGKGLNDVQGKVALGELYNPGGTLGNSLGGSGLSVSGLGQLNESEIEKALAKYLQRFQFCYEKALLSDSSLGGNVVLQWTISSSGKGQSPKVLTSQLNNNDLHACLSKVLKEIPFPHPKGGTVQVKKTFSFSSSSI